MTIEHADPNSPPLSYILQNSMGLSLSVGLLSDTLFHDREVAQVLLSDIGKVNRTLQRAGLNTHCEPVDCPYFRLNLHGYYALHFLRRIAAHLNYRGCLPAPVDQDAADDPLLSEYYKWTGYRKLPWYMGPKIPRQGQFNHLMLHSDSNGYYIPLEFDKVLIAEDPPEMGGSLIGSTFKLLQELEIIAKWLELPLNMDPLSDEFEEMQLAKRKDKIWQRYQIESHTCLNLYHAAHYAASQRALLCFC